MKKTTFTKKINKKALLGAAIGIGVAMSASAPSFAVCGSYNPCRAKKSTYSGGNPCSSYTPKVVVNPCASHNPCAAHNPCEAVNPCASKNPCAAVNPCAAYNPCAAKKRY